MRKGIVLAGGTGTRLHPLTAVVSKQLMPVYDKPLIYYALSVLMLSGLRQILIITTAHDQEAFRSLLGDGSKWGVSFEYAVQTSPGGIAQAFDIGASFLVEGPSALILGDNIFHGVELASMLRRANARASGATVFGYHVRDPGRFGVVSLNPDGSVRSIEEKPADPQSSYAVTGLYYYDERATEYVRSLRPSSRGELEITDLNRTYLGSGALNVELLGPDCAWFDTGTHRSLLDAGIFTSIVEERQGQKVCCPEEVAWRMGYISSEDLARIAHPLRNSSYGLYLANLLSEDHRTAVLPDALHPRPFGAALPVSGGCPAPGIEVSTAGDSLDG